ncbi:MAG: ATP-binding protein [Burkholderiaceae bacterium]
MRFFRNTALTGQFNLQRWFALVSLAAITAISAVAGSLLSWFMTERLLLQEAVLTKEFVHSLVQVEESLQRYFADPSAALSAHTEKAFRQVAAMPNVMRANVYGTQRRVIWSSERELIGREFGPNPELDKALRGNVVIEFASHERPEHGKQEHQGRALEDAFVEIYVPVRNPGDQRVQAVIEFYKNPRSLLGSIKSLRIYVAVGAGLSGVVLFVALFGTVRRAAKLIEAQQKQLVEKETLAVIGEMSSAVAHGIRNPLASIRSSAEVIPLSDASGVSQAVQDIVAESERLEAWVRELLSYTRPLVETETRVAMHDLVERCAQDFDRELQRRGITLALECPAELPAVRGDPMLFAQVLRSLLTNALEATARSGHISLIGRRDDDAAMVTVSVQDNGSGMTPAELARAGTPFQTTKPRGMGVGLALARRIVERFGGRLTIESALGRGTVVRVQLRIA